MITNLLYKSRPKVWLGFNQVIVNFFFTQINHNILSGGRVIYLINNTCLGMKMWTVKATRRIVMEDDDRDWQPMYGHLTGKSHLRVLLWLHDNRTLYSYLPAHFVLLNKRREPKYTSLRLH
jgi:hypothetical protein